MRNAKSLMEDLTFSKKEEIFQELAIGKNLRVERILSSGQQSDTWYDQDEEEVVYLVQGEACIRYEDSHEVAMEAGDMLFLPAHCKHKVTYTSEECVWLCIFSRKGEDEE